MQELNLPIKENSSRWYRHKGVKEEMAVADFSEFKSLQDPMNVRNFSLNEDNETVLCNRIMTPRLNSLGPRFISYQMDKDGPVYKVNIFKKQKSRPTVDFVFSHFSDNCRKSFVQYKVPMSLFSSGVIARVHHRFFNAPPS